MQGTTTYTYDNNGNTTRKTGPTETANYTYDYENRLIAGVVNGQRVDYTYDGKGNRVSKTDTAGTTRYIVDTNNNTGYSQVVLETDGIGDIVVGYVYGDDLISQSRGTNTFYYHYDGLGSTRNLTDTTSTLTDSYWYYGFGDILSKTGITPNNYLFTGEQFDPNIGFYYLRARYYNTETGRFITADPIEGSIYDPISLHKYLYARGDPIDNIDPTGFLEMNIIGTLTTIVLRGLIIGAINAPISGSISIMRGKSFWLGALGGFTSGFLTTILITSGVLPWKAISASQSVSQFIVEMIKGRGHLSEWSWARITIACVLGAALGGIYQRFIETYTAQFGETIPPKWMELVTSAGKAFWFGLIRGGVEVAVDVSQSSYELGRKIIEEWNRRIREALREL